jgi:hypothetical protein
VSRTSVLWLTAAGRRSSPGGAGGGARSRDAMEEERDERWGAFWCKIICKHVE